MNFPANYFKEKQKFYFLNVKYDCCLLKMFNECEKTVQNKAGLFFPTLLQSWSASRGGRGYPTPQVISLRVQHQNRKTATP